MKYSIQAKKCTNIWQQTKGLMFSVPYPIVFILSKPQLVPLHSFFVRGSFDVFYLDAKYRVVEIKRNFRPFSFYNPKNQAIFILETPVNKLKAKVGDVIRIK